MAGVKEWTVKTVILEDLEAKLNALEREDYQIYSITPGIQAGAKTGPYFAVVAWKLAERKK